MELIIFDDFWGREVKVKIRRVYDDFQFLVWVIEYKFKSYLEVYYYVSWWLIYFKFLLYVNNMLSILGVLVYFILII